MTETKPRNRKTKTNRSRRSGTLTETAPGRWRLRAPLGTDVDGIFKQASKTVYTKKRGGRTEALEKLAEFVRETEENHPGIGRASTFGSLLDDWLNDLLRQGKSPNTVDTYRTRVEKHIRPALGAIRLGKLTAWELDQFYGQLALPRKDEDGKAILDKDGDPVPILAPSTIIQVHAIISGALSQAVRWKLIRENVARDARPPKVVEVERETLSPETVIDLIGWAVDDDPDMGMLVTLAVLTGARRGELVGLQWSDIDEEKRLVRIARSLVPAPGGGHREGPPKSGKPRTLAIGDAGVMAIRAYRASQIEKLGHKPAGRLLSYDGVNPLRAKSVSHFITALGKRVGVPIHTHELRHFHLSTLNALGVDPKTIQGRGGHSTLEVTAGYIHGISALDMAAVEKLATRLQLSPPAAER